MNFQSLKANFIEYIKNTTLDDLNGQKNIDLVKDNSSIFFEYDDKFKEFLQTELNFDNSICSKSIDDILKLDIVEGQLVDTNALNETEGVEKNTETKDITDKDIKNYTDKNNVNVEDPDLVVSVINDLLNDDTFREALGLEEGEEITKEMLEKFFDTIKCYDEDENTISLEDLLGAIEDIQNGVFTFVTDTEIEEIIGDTPLADEIGLTKTSGSTMKPSVTIPTVTPDRITHDENGKAILENMTTEELQKELTSAKQEVSEKENALEKAKNDKSSGIQKLKEAEQQAYKDLLSALSGDSGLSQELIAAQEKVDQKQEAVDAKQEEIDNQEELINNQEQNIEDIESNIEGLEEQKTQYETQKTELESQKTQAESQKSSAQANLSSLESQLASLQSQNEDGKLSAQIAAIEAQIQQVEQEIQRLDEQIASLDEQIGGVEEQIGGVEEQIQGAQEELEQAQEELEESKEKLEELQVEKEELDLELQQAQEELDQVEQQAVSAHPEVEEYKRKYDEARQETIEKTKVFDENIEKAQQELDKAKDYVREVEVAIAKSEANDNIKENYSTQPQGDELVDFASKFEGYSEKDVESVCGYNLPDGLWCAAFCKFALKETYGDNLPDWYTNCNYNSCSEVLAAANKNDSAFTDGSKAQAGDLIIFNTNRGQARHIGIVTAINSDGTVETIEGNSSNKVSRRTYKLNTSRINSFVRVAA